MSTQSYLVISAPGTLSSSEYSVILAFGTPGTRAYIRTHSFQLSVLQGVSHSKRLVLASH